MPDFAPNFLDVFSFFPLNNITFSTLYSSKLILEIPVFFCDLKSFN